jgi:Arc/MetJ-type ribon-helix-helix transcriptional regulator
MDMQVTLDSETQAMVANEVEKGHFASADAFLNTAVRHFLIAQEYGEVEANKLAVLRQELRQADLEIDRGEYTEYDIDTLPNLFKETREEALQRLGRRPSNS